MKHYKAIRCIERRITELNAEIIISSKIMDNPEMMADYHFASNDIKNFTQEIRELQETAKSLVKND